MEIGDRFGKWTVIEPNCIKKHQKNHSRTRCDCGRESVVQNKIYSRKRRAGDPLFRLITNIRNGISEVIARGCKSARSLELLGCSREEHIEYIQAKFTEGMSWDNYGNTKDSWNIDHIRPVSSFDLTLPEEQQACFHYSNTQPMWAMENNYKRTKMPETVSV